MNDRNVCNGNVFETITKTIPLNNTLYLPRKNIFFLPLLAGIEFYYLFLIGNNIVLVVFAMSSIKVNCYREKVQFIIVEQCIRLAVTLLVCMFDNGQSNKSNKQITLPRIDFQKTRINCQNYIINAECGVATFIDFQYYKVESIIFTILNKINS